MVPLERHPYVIVDVFADAPLRGNPLAVVPEADALPESVMRAIAAEFNLSETTFVLAPAMRGADVRLRSFTPAGEEVGGAGHNALGALWWLVQTQQLGEAAPRHYQIGESVLSAWFEAGPTGAVLVRLKQGAPIDAPYSADVPELAAALRLSTADIRAERESTAIVSTGSPHLLVELVSNSRVDAVVPNPGVLGRLLAAAGAEGCYVYSLEHPGPETAYTRFFNPTVGISEDPATGTAAGPLGWHLARRGLAVWGTRLTILQGVRMGRASRVTVITHPGEVWLEGAAVLAAEGELYLP